MVECQLPKLDVASSNLAARSKIPQHFPTFLALSRKRPRRAVFQFHPTSTQKNTALEQGGQGRGLARAAVTCRARSSPPNHPQRHNPSPSSWAKRLAGAQIAVCLDHFDRPSNIEHRLISAEIERLENLERHRRRARRPFILFHDSLGRTEARFRFNWWLAAPRGVGQEKAPCPSCRNGCASSHLKIRIGS